MKKILISMGLMLLLFVATASAYGGGGGGIVYLTSYKTTNHNSIASLSFNEQTKVIIENKGVNTTVNFPTGATGTIDFYKTVKYNGQKVGNIVEDMLKIGRK